MQLTSGSRLLTPDSRLQFIHLLSQLVPPSLSFRLVLIEIRAVIEKMKQIFLITLIFNLKLVASGHEIDSIKPVAAKKTAYRGVLGTTKQGRNIEAYYFPGTSNKRAIVIGGMHGSELSSIEIARVLISELQQGKRSYFNVIIIPTLFPDNAEKAKENPELIGSTTNLGRYSSSNWVDPNRQIPSLGKSFNNGNPVDNLGRAIEQENQVLLELIEKYRPQRIINIHAIRDKDHAGIFAIQEHLQMVLRWIIDRIVALQY